MKVTATLADDDLHLWHFHPVVLSILRIERKIHFDGWQRNW